VEGSAATQSLFYCANCWQQNTITQPLFVLHLLAKTLMLQKFLKAAHKKTQTYFISFAANFSYIIYRHCTNHMFMHNQSKVSTFWRLTQTRQQVSPCGICGLKSGTLADCPQALQLLPVSAILPMLHVHLRVKTTVTRRTNGHSLGICGKQRSFANLQYFHFSLPFKGLNC